MSVCLSKNPIIMEVCDICVCECVVLGYVEDQGGKKRESTKDLIMMRRKEGRKGKEKWAIEWTSRNGTVLFK